MSDNSGNPGAGCPPGNIIGAVLGTFGGTLLLCAVVAVILVFAFRRRIARLQSDADGGRRDPGTGEGGMNCFVSWSNELLENLYLCTSVYLFVWREVDAKLIFSETMNQVAQIEFTGLIDNRLELLYICDPCQVLLFSANSF